MIIMEKKKGNSQKLCSNQTTVEEFLNVVRYEYNLEFDKKQSIESRSCALLAILGVILVIFLEQVSCTQIYLILQDNLNFFKLVNIISLILIVLGFFYTLFMIVNTLNINQYKNFNVESLDESSTANDASKEGVYKFLIRIYTDIISQHRKENEKKAKSFQYSLYGVQTMLIAMIVYIISK